MQNIQHPSSNQDADIINLIDSFDCNSEMSDFNGHPSAEIKINVVYPHGLIDLYAEMLVIEECLE